MGIRFVVKNGDFAARAINYVPPVAAGLEYLNFFGGSENLARNLAPGKPPGLVIGAPAFTANSMTPTQMANYIQTAVPHTDEMTFMVVAKAPGDDADSHIISNYWSPRAGGVGTTIGASVMVRKVSPEVDGQVRDVLVWSHWDGISSASVLYAPYIATPRPVSELKAMFGTISKVSRVGNIINKTAGLAAQSSPIPAGKTTDLGGPFRIGSSYLSVAGALPSEILFAAIWSRVLTEVEIDVMYEAVKGYYANRGITV
jgi:hypothetical protein